MFCINSHTPVAEKWILLRGKIEVCSFFVTADVEGANYHGPAGGKPSSFGINCKLFFFRRRRVATQENHLSTKQTNAVSSIFESERNLVSRGRICGHLNRSSIRGKGGWLRVP